MVEPSATPAIVVDGVSKRYGRFCALDNVSFGVAPGEIYGLLGPNGSGKSTLIRTLAGSLLPTAGRLAIAGYDVFKQPMQARSQLGYMPEMAPTYDHMRVDEFLRFMARLHRLPPERVEDAIAATCARLRLDDVRRVPIRALSRGYRQRVALAQALLHNPAVLILDEPTNGLDPQQIIDVRTLLRELAGRHTILLSSHILSEVEKIADRVAVLLHGRLLGSRTVANGPPLEDWFLALTRQC